MDDTNKFGKSRFKTRLYAFAWTILEKRDKEFDIKKIMNQDWVMTILDAMNFATAEESRVMKDIAQLSGSKPDLKDKRGDTLALLEGKTVIYANLDPRLLLEERDFLNTFKF